TQRVCDVGHAAPSGAVHGVCDGRVCIAARGGYGPDMRHSRSTPPVTRRTLREVAKMRRAEIEREADRAWLEAAHDVELLERLQALHSPAHAESRHARGWTAPGARR